MNAPEALRKHLFTVTIGVRLPPATVKRIAQAIQRSVLSELASAEINTPLAINFLGARHSSAQETTESAREPTQGIAVEPSKTA
jgi:hypothetical protein